MPDTCLVLGGSGFLGREAVPQLAQSFRIVATSMHQTGDYLRKADIRDPGALAALVKETQPAVVVLLAAYRDPDFCEEHPVETARLNVSPSRTLVDILPARAKLLFVSTDYVFDGKHPPYGEDAPRHPLSVYGRTKMEAEDIVLSRRGSLVLRVPLLMGWTRDPRASGFFSQLIADVTSDQPVLLDDVLARYPVWTRDAGAAMRMLLERGERGVFHYSTPRRLTRYQAALDMAESLGRSAGHIQPSREVVPRKAVRPHDARLATRRWDELGLPAPHDFRAVAREFVDRFNLCVEIPRAHPL